MYAETQGNRQAEGNRHKRLEQDEELRRTTQRRHELEYAVDELTTRCKHLINHNAELEEELAGKQEALNTSFAKLSAMESSHTERELLLSQHTQRQEALEAEASESRAQSERIAELEQAMSDYGRLNEELDIQIKNLRQEAQETTNKQSSNEMYQGRLHEAATALFTYQSESVRANEEIAKNRAVLLEHHSKLAATEADVEGLREELASSGCAQPRDLSGVSIDMSQIPRQEYRSQEYSSDEIAPHLHGDAAGYGMPLSTSSLSDQDRPMVGRIEARRFDNDNEDKKAKADFVYNMLSKENDGKLSKEEFLRVLNMAMLTQKGVIVSEPPSSMPMITSAPLQGANGPGFTASMPAFIRTPPLPSRAPSFSQALHPGQVLPSTQIMPPGQVRIPSAQPLVSGTVQSMRLPSSQPSLSSTMQSMPGTRQNLSASMQSLPYRR
jgi:hypothetical protein